MKLVVIGGSGLIGTKLVNRLRRGDHEVVAASLASGVNIITGEGLTRALAGAQVKTAVLPSPFHHRNPRRILLAALLAVLSAATVYQGIGSPFSSAAPRPAPPSHAMTPITEQSLPAYPADADADVSPGQCEPVLVSAP